MWVPKKLDDPRARAPGLSLPCSPCTILRPVQVTPNYRDGHRRVGEPDAIKLSNAVTHLCQFLSVSTIWLKILPFLLYRKLSRFVRV